MNRWPGSCHRTTCFSSSSRWRQARSSYRYERKRPDGTYLDIRNVRLPDGGWIGTETDITEIKKTEVALKEKEERLAVINQRLELAAGIVALGIWDWDLKTNLTRWDDRLYQIFGLPTSEEITYEKWKQLVHPEDLPMAKAAMAKMLDTGEEDSKKGFLNLTPQKSIDKSTELFTGIPPIFSFPDIA